MYTVKKIGVVKSVIHAAVLRMWDPLAKLISKALKGFSVKLQILSWLLKHICS